jgi:hypothetical protein
VWLEPGGARVVDVTRFVRRRHVGLTMRSGSVDSDEMAAEAVDLRD